MFRLQPSVFATIAVTAAWLASALPATAAEPVSGRFELIDHSGAAVTERSYDGKLRVVFFGFTRCPYVCPTTLVELGGALRELGEAAAEIQPLFITVDPANDTPETLSRYVAAFHPSLVGLTGSEAQLEAAAREFNVAYGSHSAPGATPYHSSYLYVMDRQG